MGVFFEKKKYFLKNFSLVFTAPRGLRGKQKTRGKL
jgi:hypothetical protein